MPTPSNSHTLNVGTAGKITIVVTQISQNWAANNSLVEVSGSITNEAPGTVAHSPADITASISGEQSFTGKNFEFSLASGSSMTFIDHQFVVSHASDGTKTVTFQVNFGDTKTTTFGSNQNVSVVLTLTRIPQPPGKPGNPTFSNILSETMTVTWNGSSDDGGNVINGYHLRRYVGSSASGNFTDNFAGNLSRNIAGLTPGQVYTFTVLAENDSKVNFGLSVPSDPVTTQVQGGCWIRVNGKWVIAVPYVRYEGKWALAIPYVRFGGVWVQTS